MQSWLYPFTKGCTVPIILGHENPPAFLQTFLCRSESATRRKR